MPTRIVGAPPNQAIRVDTRKQSLADALLDIAKQSGLELMLAAPAARTMPAPKIHGRYSVDDALSRLLAGSGLTFRQSADGAYVVTTLARAPAEGDAVAVPDILVTGKKTQNSDIRRGENDIQPYKVWTSDDVAQSHSADIDAFLRNRVTSNVQRGSAGQMAGGDNTSQVDLRGLGPGQTLVLVDGRRMPSGAAVNVNVFQPDLNGIPLSAIERIEVLNSTAGGIYGPGATAGVINVVLKRDYRGVEVGMTYGLSDRGDAATRRLDARIGATSDSGRTRAMIAVSRTWGADLRTGDRDFTTRARALWQRRDPSSFAASSPVSSAVNIVSVNGDTLKLDPAYGGTSLGAATTHVPVDYRGVAADGGALFQANAGQLDSSLSPDGAGARSSLLARPRLASLLGNVRHSFNNRFEIYADLLLLENASQATVASESQSVVLDADAASNPFQQDIIVSLPLPGYATVIRYRNRTARLTSGFILDLPHAWKMNADYSVGRAATKTTMTGMGAGLASAFGSSASVLGSSVNPLGGQAALLASIAPFNLDHGLRVVRRNDVGDLTLHLAGPIVAVGGGPLTLSMLAEDRHEHIAAAMAEIAAYPPGQTVPAFRISARSAYLELRAPLIDRVAGPAGLRGLELQLAMRYDVNRSTLPANVGEPAGSRLSSKESATAYTAGLRFFPVGSVMIRASVASGFLPPTASQISASSYSYTSSATLLAQSSLPNVGLILPTSGDGPADSARGGAKLGSEAVTTVLSGGSTHLLSERARSISAGIVFTPTFVDRLRLSVDYTRIDKRHEIVDFHYGDQAYFLAHESQFPGRVIRAPLTDTDRAKGYSGGIVTVIDTTSFNIGKTLVEAVDVQFDYRIPTETIGDFRVNAAGTWQPRLTRHYSSESAPTNSAGYADGPLTWRANGGISWQRGPLDLGLVTTYYHGSRAAMSADSAEVAAQTTLLQGGTRIPAQVYFDVFAVHRVALRRAPAGLTSLDVRFGIQDLFDHRPPIIVTAYGPKYSLYGDPRLRRFELSVVGHY